MNYKDVNYNNTFYVHKSLVSKTQDLSKKTLLSIRSNISAVCVYWGYWRAKSFAVHVTMFSSSQSVIGISALFRVSFVKQSFGKVKH